MRERPELQRLGAKLTTLDRMIEFRAQSLKDGNHSRAQRPYYVKELEALRAAKVAAQLQYALVEGLDEPLGLLREIVAAYEGPADAEGRLRHAVKRARSLLEEYQRD